MKFTANNSGPHELNLLSFGADRREVTAHVDLLKGETIEVSIFKAEGGELELHLARASHNSGGKIEH
jgi:hypothetical protein